MRVFPGVATPLAPGLYQYNTVIATGPVLLQISTDDGATFRTMTDGSIAATGDGTFQWGKGYIFKATVPSGDTLDISLASSGAT